MLDSISSCLGLGRHHDEGEREPLLPRYNGDTTMQIELRQKLHSYQMYAAVKHGYLPSNKQLITNLRTLLPATARDPGSVPLSNSGKLLVDWTRQWLQQLIKILQEKNDSDQIQDLVWYLLRSDISVDVDDIAQRASRARQTAQTRAAIESVRTVGSLLLTNSDFRLFLSDLGVIGREVLKDSTKTISKVAEDVGNQVEPSKEEVEALQKPGADANPPPSTDELQNGIKDTATKIGQGAGEVASAAEESATKRLTSNEGQTALHRLKQAVAKLRQRNDYAESVSTISLLLQRYIKVYTRAVEETVDTAEQDLHTNKEMEKAAQNFWLLLTSFGEKKQWELLEAKFHQVLSHKDHDPNFENLMIEFGNSIRDLLMDPSFFDNADERLKSLREKSQNTSTESSFRNDVDQFLMQMRDTAHSVLEDREISKLIENTLRIVKLLSPSGDYVNRDLIGDAVDVFVPLLIQLIQYIPIPRLEVSTPSLDLLIENLIIEPGKTVNHSSFLPYRLSATTTSDLELRRTHIRTAASAATTHVTLRIDGLSLRAEDFGFWLRARPASSSLPFFSFVSQGIASFALDRKGIDIHVDFAIGRNAALATGSDELDKVITLTGVRVHIHSFDYSLHKSRLRAFVSWLARPILQPLIRVTIEQQLAHAIADNLRAANRELVFARERLRATRVADPDSLITFVKAVMARLSPEPDPDLYLRLGIDDPGEGRFKGVYTPASLVKVWQEELRTAQATSIRGSDGWRNDIFDVPTQSSSML